MRVEECRVIGDHSFSPSRLAVKNPSPFQGRAFAGTSASVCFGYHKSAKAGFFTSTLEWDTPEDGNSIMGGILGLVRELAVELNQLGKLDDGLLTRVEDRSTRNVKGTDFTSNAPLDTEQLRLMDFVY
jgi:hypothetical protein